MFLRTRAHAARSYLSAILESDRVDLFVSLHPLQEKLRIVYHASAPIEHDENARPLPARLEVALVRACQQVASEGLPHVVSHRRMQHHFDAIDIFYGAPWYVSRSRQIVMERVRPELPITESSLQQLVAQYVDGMLPSDAGGLHVLEQGAHGFTINGYPVMDVVGKTGKEIGVRLFASAADAETCRVAEQAIGRFFSAPEVRRHSTLFPTIQILSRALQDQNDYLLVDVSGYVTELSLIREGAIVETASFPQGHATVVQRAARQLNRRADEVGTMLRRPADFADAPTIAAALEDACGAWGQAYGAILKTVGVSASSHSAVLVVGTPLAERFNRAMAHAGARPIIVASSDLYRTHCDVAVQVRKNAPIGALLLAGWRTY